MDVLHPPRIHTLNPQTIRVIQHMSHTRSEELVLTNVFPFETMYSLKQRIALAHTGDKQWLPSQLFVAQEETTQYKSLEFTWPFGKQLMDPFTPSIVGKPDVRIYKDDSRLPVFPTILSGITLEAAGLLKQPGQVLHVWNLASVATASGYGPGILPTNESFEGFFQLYFPAITSRDVFNGAFSETTESDKEAFRVAANYRSNVESRYAKLEASLHSESMTTAYPVELRELRKLRYALPKKHTFSSGSLEVKFYEIEPSDVLPFVRFFPAQDRLPPLIKLAATATGASKIADTRLLDSFMAEQPATDMGSVIVIKSPIQHARAPLGAAWTLRILEDGSAELYIGAPRKDAPLTYTIVEEAFRILPEFLAATPWRDATDLMLVELSAAYEYKSQLPNKPTKSELRARIDPLLPLFSEEKLPSGSTASLSLKYKAVSNYVADNDPILNYITSLFMRDRSSSLQESPVQLYIASLIHEFGISSGEASEYIQQWITRNEGYDQTDMDTGVPSVNLGSIVNIYNLHPKYLFQIVHAESEFDVKRIITLMTLLATQTAAELRISDTQEKIAEAVEAIQVQEAEVPVVEDQAAPIEFDDLDFAMMGLDPGMDLPSEAEVIEEEKAIEVISDAAVPIHPPALLAKGETLPSLDKEWFLSRIKQHDAELVGYTNLKEDPRIKVYSRACQRSQNKQPNVMSPETYLRVRTLYGNEVFWVEGPLEGDDMYSARIATKSVGERFTYAKSIGKTFDQIIALEKRALNMGFPLKNDQSVVHNKEKTKGKVIKEEDVTEIGQLIALQKTKPLWIVTRVGTLMDKPNYYICSEYWCLRDDMPLISSEFVGTLYRNGAPKEANSCAFCGGVLLTNNLNPLPGETVLKRDPTTKGGPIAKYSGVIDTLWHPDKFVLPCCYSTPDNFDVPEGAHPLPPPKVPLPDIQRVVGVQDVLEEAVPVPEKERELQEKQQKDVRENRDRPFSPLGKKDGVVSEKKNNSWFIPTQNILGRTTLDWFKLEKGDIAVPPPSINTLMGQDPEKFLTRVKGVLGEKINSHLAIPGSAFIRYGIGNSLREPGSNLISLIAYAKYATEHFLSESDDAMIPTNEEVIQDMLVTKEVSMVRAFEQANYGTLLHEFSLPGHSLPAEREVEFQTWWSRIGLTVSDQRAYAESLFLAWDNFKNYVRDSSEHKELRIWESLFACPGLLTKTGFLIVRISYPKNKDEQPTILCPTFGISYANQLQKPPLLFLLEDRVSGLYDPLVFYEGVTKEERRVLGVLQDERDSFGRLSPAVRAPLQAFLSDFISADGGCGRSAEPIHPWIPGKDTTLVPKLGEFMARVGDSDVVLRALLRDRSNRLVGAIVLFNKVSYYVPCMDDGTVLPQYPSLRGEGAMPLPSLQTLLEMITGLQIKISEKKLGSIFPGLMPKRLMTNKTNFIALELECGATVPFEQFPFTSDIKHRRFAEMRKSSFKIKLVEDLPWETDISLLGPAPPDAEQLGQTSEEILDEAYQHLRISFSNWLHTSESGIRVRQQIELLRQARRRLPLYELQKRIDLLLTPIVSNPSNPWITTEGKPYSSVLRRDCLQINREDACIAGCSWSSGRCLIHATSTPRYVDPVRVLIARLGDELLRSFGFAMEILNQHVPYLKPLPQGALIKEGDSLLFSASGRGNPSLYYKLGYTDRKPTTYMMGLTYPEEVEFEEDVSSTGLPTDWESTLHSAIFGADISRDKRAMMEAALISYTGKPITDLERQLGESLRGTQEQWKKLATLLHVEVILTKLNPSSRRIEPFAWYTSKSDKYIIVDTNGVPLQQAKTGEFAIPMDSLPASLSAWLDVHSPT